MAGEAVGVVEEGRCGGAAGDLLGYLETGRADGRMSFGGLLTGVSGPCLFSDHLTL